MPKWHKPLEELIPEYGKRFKELTLAKSPKGKVFFDVKGLDRQIQVDLTNRSIYIAGKGKPSYQASYQDYESFMAKFNQVLRTATIKENKSVKLTSLVNFTRLLTEDILTEGATSIYTVIKGDAAKVKKVFAQLAKEDTRGVYSGGWGTFSDVKFFYSDSFANTKKGRDAARQFVLDNSEKWEYAAAVPLGKNAWMLGGWAAE